MPTHCTDTWRAAIRAGTRACVPVVLLLLLTVHEARADGCTPQTARVRGTGEIGAGQFGASVSLSSDGETLAVGAPSDAASTGAVYLFAHSGGHPGIWTQTARLVPMGQTGAGQFGSRIALSADAMTLVIGAPGDSSNTGAAYIFARAGSAWSQQGSKLVPSGLAASSRFGGSVAMNEAGTAMVVGAPQAAASVGAAYPYVRSGSTWTQDGPALSPSGGVGAGQFGISVSMSSAGNAALVGAYVDNGNAGAAYVYSRSVGSGWSQQGPKLGATGAAGPGQFGSAVSLSGDGLTALIGASATNNQNGAAYIFQSINGSWSPQGPVLLPVGGVGAGMFGFPVTLSRDGMTALIGARGDNTSAGAAYVFVRSGNTWAQQGGRILGTGGTSNGLLGFSVALDQVGSVAVAGALNDNNGVGAAYAFDVVPPLVLVQQPAANFSAPSGGSTSLSVTATSTVPITYQWRQGEVNLSDGMTIGGSQVTGTSTPTLTLSSARIADSGTTWDCVITDVCGGVPTITATLTITCPPDFNHTDGLSVQDIFDFLSAWFAGDPNADFNGAQGLDPQDIFDFLAAWFAGCT